MDATAHQSSVAKLIATIASLVALGSILVACDRARHRLTRPLHVDTEIISARRPWIAQRLGQLVTTVLPMSSEPAIDRTIGRSIMCGACIALVAPALGATAILISPVVLVQRARKRGQRASRSSVDALAEVIDLFSMALSSGATVAAAVRQAAQWAPDPLGDVFERCVDDVRLGCPLAESLETVSASSGAHIRPLVAALVAHDRYGAPILQNLSQLATDARSDRRRRAEAEARRLPVTLLFPLVLCVLPAFLLLTVVPVVADTIVSLDFLASL